MSYRWWLITSYRRVEPCEAGFSQVAQSVGADYMRGQFEVCPSTGRIHLQAVVWFRKNVRVTKFKPDHAEPTRSEAALAYVCKDETRIAGPFEWGEKPLKRNDKTDWEEVRSLAKKGELDKINAQVFVTHYNKLKQIKNDYQELEVEPLPLHLQVLEEGQILLEGKRKHLWLWSSEPNTGKTTFARTLSRYGSHEWVYEENFQDVVRGCQVLIMDEFRGQVPVSKLNRLCDGSGIPRKGQSALPFSGIVIVCSNRSPEQVYKNQEDWPLIYARFNIFNLTKKF